MERRGDRSTMGVRVLLLIAIVTEFLCFNYVGAYAPEMPCKEFISAMTKAQMAGIKDCAKTLKIKDGKEKATKMNCIIKCIMMKEGLLNAEGLYSKEHYQKTADRMPVNLAEKGNPLMMKCGEDSVGVLDPADPFCKSYGTMVTCLMGVVGKLCKD